MGVRPDDRPARALRVELWVAVMGGAASLAFALLTPPMQVPDEERHFALSFAIASGQLLPRLDTRRPRDQVPCAVAELRDRVDSAVRRRRAWGSISSSCRWG